MADFGEQSHLVASQRLSVLQRPHRVSGAFPRISVPRNRGAVAPNEEWRINALHGVPVFRPSRVVGLHLLPAQAPVRRRDGGNAVVFRAAAQSGAGMREGVGGDGGVARDQVQDEPHAMWS